MVQWLIKGFLVMVAIFFVLQYPDRIMDFIQLFIDSAQKTADALSHVNPQPKN